MDFLELTHRQSLELTDTLQLFEAMREAEARLAHYKGSMHWKVIRNRKYLYHMFGKPGQGKSLGPESKETCEKLRAFRQGKEGARARLLSLRQNMDEKAALNRAVGLARVSMLVARIIRELEHQGLLGKVMLVGTWALYAYESMAGVMIHRGLLATADADFLWDNRTKVSFATQDVDGFLSILQKVDRSFHRSEQSFRAINESGFMVDLIVPAQTDMRLVGGEQMGDTYDLKAAGIGSLKWLINSPKVESVILDARGYPLRVIVPDPRSFAIHKLWLSKQLERRADKADRDKQQALLVAQLVLNRLPQFHFTSEEMKMFPKDIAEQAVSGLDIN